MARKYEYYKVDDLHVFGPNLDDPTKLKIAIGTPEYAAMVNAYTSAGEGLTKAGVAAQFGRTVKEVGWVFAYGPQTITKDSPPFLAEELNSSTVEELRLRFSETKYRNLQKAIANEKEEQKNKAKSKSLEREIFRDLVIKTIKETLTTFSPTEPVVVEDKVTDSAIVYSFQDWHAGAAYTLPEGDVYNSDVFRDRIEQCRNYITLGPDVDSVYLAFVGDLVDAVLSNMHGDQARNQDTYGMAQIKLASKAVIDLTHSAMERYPDKHISIVAVPGNHDRMDKDKSVDSSRIASQIIFGLVDQYFHKQPQVSIHSFEDDWCVFQVTPKQRVCLNHGDNSAKPDNMVLMDSVNHALYRTILSGHHHERKIEEGARWMKITMPALMGPSPFIRNKICKYKRPGQGVVLFRDLPDNKFAVTPMFIDLV